MIESKKLTYYFPLLGTIVSDKAKCTRMEPSYRSRLTLPIGLYLDISWFPDTSRFGAV